MDRFKRPESNRNFLRSQFAISFFLPYFKNAFFADFYCIKNNTQSFLKINFSNILLGLPKTTLMQIIQSIQNRIYEIRGERVMLDRDLASLYKIETRVLNQAVKRNIKRFPADFMFRLTKAEFESIKFKINTTNEHPGMSSQIVMTYPEKRPVTALP